MLYSSCYTKDIISICFKIRKLNAVIMLFFYKYVSRQAKRDLLGVKIEKRSLDYVNSFIFPESEFVRYMNLSQLWIKVLLLRFTKVTSPQK